MSEFEFDDEIKKTWSATKDIAMCASYLHFAGGLHKGGNVIAGWKEIFLGRRRILLIPDS
jgi:hypothetical protein